VKILHLLKTPVGAAWAFRLIERTQGLGIRNSVFMPEGDGKMKEKYRGIGVSVEPSPPLESIPGAWNWIRSLRRHLARKTPDLVHSHFFNTTVASRYAMKGGPKIPRIFQIPGPLHLEHALPRWWDRLSGGEEDFYIATCAYTRELLVGKMGVPRGKVFLSYYGTDVDRFGPGAKGLLRKMIGAGSRKIVGMVAWMYPPKWYLGQWRGIKGHEVFLDAMPRVLREYPECLAVIIGGQWGNGDSYEGRLKRMGKDRCGGSMIFLGPRNDVPDLYPDFDVVVHPSLSENVGGAVESLLCEVPTVTSSVGGFPDAIHDGKTGFLVPPGDPGKLAEKVIYLLRHQEEAKRMAARGHSLMREMFDVGKTSKEVIAVYEAILGKSGRSGTA
jgi:glycosyltransferase involved in cell wall biosynthesis